MVVSPNIHLKNGCLGHQEYYHYNKNKDWDTSCLPRMRFCWSPGWLIISFGFFRLSFLEGLKQLQPSSSSIIKPSSSSSSSSSHHHHHHHHHHPFVAATSPIGISGFFSPTKNPTPPPTLPADFFEVQAGDGGMWHVPPKQTTKTHGQARKTQRYFEKQTYGCFRK